MKIRFPIHQRISRSASCLAVFVALFAAPPLGAQTNATNLRVQKAVGNAVLKTGEEAVILGSWVAENNPKYKDPLQYTTGGSDADMRLRMSKDVPPEEALRRWKTFREEVVRSVKAEFGREAERVLATMNVYPPRQLMGAVENTAEAASRFTKYGTVPNLSFTGSVTKALNPVLVEGLYGQGSLAWTQEYERTRGKLFFVEKNRVFTGTADLVNLIDGPEKYSAGGLGHTAEQWAEHGSGALKAGDARQVAKYLERTEMDLVASRGLAELDKTGPWREELQALQKELTDSPAALRRLEPRIAEALRQATQAGQVLARLDNASDPQRAVLKSFLRFTEDARNAPKVINDALLTVPWSRLLEGAMVYVATAEISKAAAERDLAKALSEASPFLLPLGPAMLTMLAQEIITQARSGGHDLVAGYQDAFDLLAGLISMKGFEDAGVATRTVSIDRLAELYREGQEEYLRSVILYLCYNATTLDGEANAEARDALYARCMPVLLKAWQARRQQWRKAAIALKASYGKLPFHLSYEPAPVPFDAAKGKAIATVSYGFEHGSDDQLDRLRGLLRRLYGALAYADLVVEWHGDSQRTSSGNSRNFTFNQPGTYPVSATRTLRLGGWPAASGRFIDQQEIRQKGIVDIEVNGLRPTAEPAPKPPVAAKTVTKTPVAALPAAPARVPATGVWVLEKTEFVVQELSAEWMQKLQPTESGEDGAGSAQGIFGHPDPKVNTVTVRMKVAWTPPPKVLVPGEAIDFRITVSDAGTDARGLGVGGAGSIIANYPSRSAVWHGPAAHYELKLGERSKEASKAYTPLQGSPGDTMYIYAEYGVFIRRNQYFYLYKFTADPASVPAAIRTSSVATAKPQVVTDRLGHEWSITEAVTYAGRWVRRGDSEIWDATWSNGAVAELSITIAGDQVRISRKDGGFSLGLTATYEGTLAPDGTVQGTSTTTWPGHFTNQVSSWQGRVVK